jgi:SanA protein
VKLVRRFPRTTLTIAIAGALTVAGVIAANALVVISSSGEGTRDIARLPHAQAALVLGAQVRPDGTMSTMLADRVEQAVKLWRAGKVDRVLVSGDHHTWAYDEPDTMRKALLKAGVPASAIFTDHAGFNTWASMVRARKVFGVRDAIVVTQGFHMARALYLAHAAGLSARGLVSDLHGYGAQGKKSDVREVLARVKAVGNAALGRWAMPPWAVASCSGPRSRSPGTAAPAGARRPHRGNPAQGPGSECRTSLLVGGKSRNLRRVRGPKEAQRARRRPLLYPRWCKDALVALTLARPQLGSVRAALIGYASAGTRGS